MLFKKRINHNELIDNPIVNEIENNIATEIGFKVYNRNKDIIGGIVRKEIEQSMIDKSILLSYFTEKREELIKFGIILYKNEQYIIDGEEYPKGEVVPKSERPVTLASYGPGIGFGITYAIYFHFLSNNKIDELSEYLKRRRIPYFKKFQSRLITYFEETIK